jgi:8-oxo-dGTP diphosphatase
LSSSPQPEVQAAGGVVRRNGGVMIVHRPKYDDWSLPKGKLEEGESFEQAALREVEEETGWRCELGRELQETRYKDNKGRDKLVRWWEMWARERGKWEPNDEVDDILWVPLADLPPVITYDSDRQLLESVR